jgi:hypothetical protein
VRLPGGFDEAMLALAVVIGVALLVGFRPVDRPHAWCAVLTLGGYLWSRRLFNCES